MSWRYNYINYASIVWGSHPSNHNQTKLQKLHSKPKHAVRIIYNEDRQIHAKPLLIIDLFTVRIAPWVIRTSSTDMGQILHR